MKSLIGMIVTADHLGINGIQHHVTRNLRPHTPEQQFARDMVLNPKTDFIVGRWFGEDRVHLLQPDWPKPSWAAPYYDGRSEDLPGDALVPCTVEVIGIFAQAVSEAAKYAQRYEAWDVVRDCLNMTSAFGHLLTKPPAGDLLIEVPVVFVVSVIQTLKRVADHISEHGWTREDEPGADSVEELDRRMARQLRIDAEVAEQLVDQVFRGAPKPPDPPMAA